jgi:hypothetical protein
MLRLIRGRSRRSRIILINMVKNMFDPNIKISLRVNHLLIIDILLRRIQRIRKGTPNQTIIIYIITKIRNL